MKITKIALLTATIMAGVATPGYAQFAFPTAEIDGVGASAVADINKKVQNCIGVDSPLGLNTGATQVITLTDYKPVPATATNPELNCSTGDDIYNSGTTTYTGQYVSTGSGFGKQQWRNFANNFSGLAGSINPFGPWTNVQYAFSESPLVPAEITDYNQDDAELINNVDVDVNASAQAGAPIQFPLYVVPVAFAYNTQYGTKGAAPLNFRVKTAGTINGLVAGGLRLLKTDYCGIWNGTITNWNSPLLKTRNANQSLGDLADVARFDSEGVPIRLVGRADRSGTTDLFTRALAAQCGTTVPNGGTNKFERAAESLPFNSSGTIDIRTIRSDARYFPGSAASNFSGTTQSLSGYVYDRTNNRFCFWNEAASAACSATPAAVTFSQFNTGGASAGLFIVADGSSSVEAAVRRVDGTNAALISPTDATVSLNGKLGYVGADFVFPTAGRTLFSAAVQKGSSTAYVMPSAANATAAFGSVLPPQSIAASGAYNTTDSRQVYKDLSNPANSPSDPSTQELVDRGNPLHWANTLYPPTGATLANPANGYPVTGPSYVLLYQCYSTPAKRSAIANFIGYTTGKITKKNAAGGTPSSITLSANTFKGAGATSLGILTKANIAVPSAGWIAAITETFLKRSTQNGGANVLGTRNLWIQSAQAAAANQLDGIGTNDILSNPNCAGKPGA